MAKVTGQDVISFFENADLDFASLVLEFGGKKVDERKEKAKKIAANLEKARSARKPKAAKAQAAISQAESQSGQDIPQPIRTERRAQARVPAPAHTAAATSVASD